MQRLLRFLEVIAVIPDLLITEITAGCENLSPSCIESMDSAAHEA